MTKLKAALAVLAVALAASGREGQDDKTKAAKLLKDAKYLRDSAKKNHEEAVELLEKSARVEAMSQNQIKTAERLEREARELLKESAEKAAAAALWSQANRRDQAARVDDSRAKSLRARAREEDASAKKWEADAVDADKKAKDEKDPKEKVSKQRAAAYLHGVAKEDFEDRDELNAQAAAYEAQARKNRQAASDMRAKAKKLDPDVGK